MKFLLILLVALLAISAVSANQCGRFVCLPGHSCIGNKGVWGCHYHCEELVIEQKVVNNWTDGVNGPASVQVQVTITNRSHQNIKDIIIASAVQLNNNQMWGVDHCTFENGVTLMDLPNYAQGIAPGASYTFGYVARGSSAANLYVEHILLM
ncbi:hypothetical protein DICPUDRAFT_149279 [Dictyostelium purpureum]|uniref:Carbohydrate binding domain-containing protein n=1 Tax=Dictyostelium purpureum TaxID=5786 RepID=F0ZDA1_DICPU|nr:uncharacterized protein DICPUDRAFT_149279 [Dictyostelium purpureum]EGC38071.1 hypothetical protein DICPUDRAFT_149279 [Dictyostelium purpureum]|eukprot:XP_003285378.1 hypothetical protein DICPUDRAFT_149279 [Dictyostelium purpureum]